MFEVRDECTCSHVDACCTVILKPAYYSNRYRIAVLRERTLNNLYRGLIGVWDQNWGSGASQ